MQNLTDGDVNPKEGVEVQTYYLARFLLKTTRKMKEIGPDGDTFLVLHLDPLMGFSHCTGTVSGPVPETEIVTVAIWIKVTLSA